MHKHNWKTVTRVTEDSGCRVINLAAELPWENLLIQFHRNILVSTDTANLKFCNWKLKKKKTFASRLE